LRFQNYAPSGGAARRGEGKNDPKDATAKRSIPAAAAANDLPGCAILWVKDQRPIVVNRSAPRALQTTFLPFFSLPARVRALINWEFENSRNLLQNYSFKKIRQYLFVKNARSFFIKLNKY